ncbi:imidazole glycerol phosphate synthase subunit HisH [uncultured Prevotella sp.]|uniref:imidazole glycerol phosphate synthase subunit HisH n=1 Tax=uncultured Prevotella sp. TaxID=159272 RepID=UPI0025CFA2C5|nr:imidazole glycerol phosphate synthase subunit HisH [uncultured Prevotella sp.]
MKVAIVKYNAGNIYSVVNSLRRLGVEPLLTDNAEQISSADRVLFPGQGEARVAMTYLKEHNLDAVIKNLKQPVLGICIGQQLLCRHSEENDTDCLGIFDADVLKFRPERHEDKVPAMGWNDLYNFKSPLFRNIEKNDSYVYFVHSYYVPVCEYTIAEADYIQPYSAAINRGNFYATQFHPEKSGAVGAQIIKNFLEIDDK